MPDYFQPINSTFCEGRVIGKRFEANAMFRNRKAFTSLEEELQLKL